MAKIYANSAGKNLPVLWAFFPFCAVARQMLSAHPKAVR
jgi:hypothetical protein